LQLRQFFTVTQKIYCWPEMLGSYLEAYQADNCTECAENVFGISERNI